MDKVIFKLKQDKDGYPPFAFESVWAKKNKKGNYIIDNTPFYVYGTSLGDEVQVKEKEGELFFVKTVTPSKNSTVRIYCDDKKGMTKVKARLTKLGCKWEGSNTDTLISVSIPPDPGYKTLEPGFYEWKKEIPGFDFETGVVRK